MPYTGFVSVRYFCVCLYVQLWKTQENIKAGKLNTHKKMQLFATFLYKPLLLNRSDLILF